MVPGNLEARRLLPNRYFLLAGHSAGITENVHLGLHY
jgi:hypothetical protein